MLLIRDIGSGGPNGSAAGLEVLMLRRNSKLAFGGMWVFPGGRVDEADRTSAGELAGSESTEHEPALVETAHGEDGRDNQAHARAAAVREAHEETGLTVDPSTLVPWSYWVPPPASIVARRGPARRFSTWFFVAPAPAGDVAIDHGEIHDDRWLAPGEALERHREGEIELVAPTWITLRQLSEHNSVAAAVEWALNNPSPEFRTRPLRRKPLTLSWAGDAAYEQALTVMKQIAEQGDQLDPSSLPDLISVPGPRHRLTLKRDGWEYEHTL